MVIRNVARPARAVVLNLTREIAPLRVELPRTRKMPDGTTASTAVRAVLPGSVTVLAGSEVRGVDPRAESCPSVQAALRAGDIEISPEEKE